MASKTETYRSLPDKRCNSIANYICDLPYTHEVIENEILPSIIQWLYHNYVNIETTCFIISSITNINKHQKLIDDIYNEHIPPITFKSNLQKFLSTQEYVGLEKQIEPRKTEGKSTGSIDDYTNIVTNFKTKQVLQEKITYKKDGSTDSKFTPIIDAVPYQLIVYDSPLLDQPRTFKITWDSPYTNRKFTTAGESSGATIKEIENYLVDAGFSHSPKLVAGALSCMINSLIKDGFADIKSTVDNLGVYYDIQNDKVTVVKLDFTELTAKEFIKGHKTLTELTKYYQDNLYCK